jgi:hypothetical protein
LVLRHWKSRHGCRVSHFCEQRFQRYGFAAEGAETGAKRQGQQNCRGGGSGGVHVGYSMRNALAITSDRIVAETESGNPKMPAFTFASCVAAGEKLVCQP